ncbi:MAG: nucleotidyltransferase domain-containing protein, partial [Methylococcales bacterium]|nr:nucleotidyltransferase domain-containing protein [Methylococcales bacterium]
LQRPFFYGMTVTGDYCMGVVALTDIQNFVADMAREFLPEKVILFGSYARGSAGTESDIDLLVVMPEDVSGARVAADIITRLKPTLPVELVVRSSRQIKERLALNDFFLREIMITGKELYAAPHH